MRAAQTLTAKSGDKLDLLIWREMGLGPSHLGRVLDANPGLADLPAILPLGTRVSVPASTDAEAQDTPTLEIIQLWS